MSETTEPTAATAPANGQDVKIEKAKGRPFLQWVGKKPLNRVQAFPARLSEHYDPTGEGLEALEEPTHDRNDPWRNLLFYGDNKEALAWLLANGYRGQVDLIYIDPPFDSGADYVRKARLRGVNTRVEGEAHSLLEQVQYEDIWANDAYLQFMYERLLMLKELLSEEGALYLHCDYRKSHHIRLLLDEVFGTDSYGSEIIWQSADAQSSADRYGPIHNTIFYYTRSKERIWNDVKTPLPRSTVEGWYSYKETVEADLVNALGETIPKGTVRRFNTSDLTARKKGGDTLYEWRVKRANSDSDWQADLDDEYLNPVPGAEYKGVRPPTGRYWGYSKENLREFDNQNRLYYTGSGRPYLKSYLDENEGVSPQDMWTDISMIRGIGSYEATGYPTEKPEALLERIVKISSNPGSVVLDCFMGSGTTAAVAQRLGRRWIGCDINKGAVQTTAKRLSSIIEEQAGTLDLDPAPASKVFSLYQVNNYDIQLRHQDAQEIVARHVGVERTRTDPFFEGTLGQDWVKIIPFTRPLTPLDVEEVRRELERREGGRDAAIIALGVEPEARNALEQNNKLLPEGAGRIRLIDLRTDGRYGGLLTHEPAAAKVRFERDGTTVRVEIEEFVSPTILKRLDLDTKDLGVHPQVADWRSMVDYVLIDTDYDGETFTVRVQDIPEKRKDVVHGTYALPDVAEDAIVAVRIVDMLGEEVLITNREENCG